MRKLDFMKKAVALFIGLSSVVTVFAQVPAYSGGAGTEADPFQITTLTDIQDMGKADTSNYFKVMNDIDYAGATHQPLWSRPAPDGSYPAPGVFGGHIDGDGKTIKNYVVNNTGWLSAGTGFFFKFSGTCDNLHFDGITTVYEGKDNVGTITGRLVRGSITNCTVKNSTVTGTNNIGGVVGLQEYGTMVEGCTVADVSVTGESSTGDVVGSLPGTSKMNPIQVATVEDVANMGAADTGSYFIMTQDIDFEGAQLQCLWTMAKKDAEGNVIVKAPGSFKGYVNGNNKTISNVVLKTEGWLKGTGFFFKLDGSVEKLNFESILASDSASDSPVGAIAGILAPGASIDSCNVVGAQVEGNVQVGSVCGYADSVSTIKGCVVSAKVIGASEVGDIVGAQHADATVEGNDFTGLVPIAKAGDDQEVNQAAEVALGGGASSDPEGAVITFVWTSLSPEITLSDVSAVSPTFVAPDVDVDTEFDFVLVVNNGTFDSAPDTVTVTVKDTDFLPVAAAGDDQEVDAGTEVTLDASASTSTSGGDLTYLWTAPEGIDLSDDTAVDPTFTAPEVTEAAEYEITVVVNDGTNDSKADTVVVTVLPTTSINGMEELAVSVYPNPVANGTTVEVEIANTATASDINVYNMQGQVVFTQTAVNENTVSISTNNFHAGVYVVSVTSEHAKKEIKMIVK